MTIKYVLKRYSLKQRITVDYTAFEQTSTTNNRSGKTRNYWLTVKDRIAWEDETTINRAQVALRWKNQLFPSTLTYFTLHRALSGHKSQCSRWLWTFLLRTALLTSKDGRVRKDVERSGVTKRPQLWYSWNVWQLICQETQRLGFFRNYPQCGGGYGTSEWTSLYCGVHERIPLLSAIVFPSYV